MTNTTGTLLNLQLNDTANSTSATLTLSNTTLEVNKDTEFTGYVQASTVVSAPTIEVSSGSATDISLTNSSGTLAVSSNVRVTGTDLQIGGTSGATLQWDGASTLTLDTPLSVSGASSIDGFEFSESSMT
ncbi:hypothetical protein ADUPG1_005206, partial [Aduncisulcus paluster]